MPGPLSGNMCLSTEYVTASFPIKLNRIWFVFLGDIEEKRSIWRIDSLHHPGKSKALASWAFGLLLYCYCFPLTPKDENKRLKIHLKIEIAG